MQQDPCLGSALGSGALGAMPMGTGSTGGLLSAVLVDNRSIQVTSAPLPGISAALPDDLLNPSNWAIVPVTPGAVVRTVLTVTEQVDDTVWLLYLSGDLTAGATYEVKVRPDLVQPGCDTEVVTVPDAPAPPLFGLRDPLDGPIDLLNPQLLRDAEIKDPPPLGTYQINDRGDLAVTTRLQGLRQRILRRFATPRGGFFHLPGYGVAPRVKGLLRPAQLRRLATEFKAQVEREPEVLAASVRVEVVEGSTDTVTVQVRARTIEGLDVEAHQTIDLRSFG